MGASNETPRLRDRAEITNEKGTEMTKQQKVDNVSEIVEEARKHYTLQEFSDMFLAIWNGFELAKTKATDGDPPA